MTRRIGTATGFQFLLLAGCWLGSSIVIALVALVILAVLGGGGSLLVPLLVVVVWTLLTPVALARPVQRSFFVRRLGAKPPTAAEQSKLGPAVTEVCGRAGVDPGRLDLFIQDSGELNAFAAGGSVLLVTTQALRVLAPAHLRAVVAHELGHHVHGHAILPALRLWLQAPVAIAWTLFRLILRAARPLTRVPLLGILIWVLLVILLPVIAVIVLLVVPATIAGSMASRSFEYAADAYAAELGYGPDLIELLTAWMNEGRDRGRAAWGWRQRLFASHPSMRERIQRIERQLALGPGAESPVPGRAEATVEGAQAMGAMRESSIYESLPATRQIGVISCPRCQGQFELQPADGVVALDCAGCGQRLEAHVGLECRSVRRMQDQGLATVAGSQARNMQVRCRTIHGTEHLVVFPAYDANLPLAAGDTFSLVYGSTVLGLQPLELINHTIGTVCQSAYFGMAPPSAA